MELACTLKGKKKRPVGLYAGAKMWLEVQSKWALLVHGEEQVARFRGSRGVQRLKQLAGQLGHVHGELAARTRLSHGSLVMRLGWHSRTYARKKVKAKRPVGSSNAGAGLLFWVLLSPIWS